MRYYTDSDFGSVFGDLLSSWSAGNKKIPAVDVYETPEAFIIEAEVAGYSEDKIDIHVDNHVLKLSSPAVSREVEKGHTVLSHEIYLPAFERSFRLPEQVDEAAITADYKSGILLVTVPKKKEAQPRRIEVKINK